MSSELEASGAAEQTFRDYGGAASPAIEAFYREHHRRQTFDRAGQKQAAFLTLDRRAMSVQEALEWADTFVDASDPDTALAQLDHSLQTAEALRRQRMPRWLVLVGLIHDLGKVLCLFGEPQWAVVGDTFPLGCAFSDTIVHQGLLAANPDLSEPRFRTTNGIYAPGCGFDRVRMTWGHDEYLYHVVRDHLPYAASYVIRYHSFYPWHQHGAYAHLADERDREMLEWLRVFQRADLYTKREDAPDWPALRPFYDELIAEHLPGRLRW